MKISQGWIYCSAVSFCFKFTCNEKSGPRLHYSESTVCTGTLIYQPPVDRVQEDVFI